MSFNGNFRVTGGGGGSSKSNEDDDDQEADVEMAKMVEQVDVTPDPEPKTKTESSKSSSSTQSDSGGGFLDNALDTASRVGKNTAETVGDAVDPVVDAGKTVETVTRASAAGQAAEKTTDVVTDTLSKAEDATEPVQKLAGTVGDKSGQAADKLTEKVGNPAAETFGGSLEAVVDATTGGVPGNQTKDITEADTAPGNAAKRAAEGATQTAIDSTVGLPREAVRLGSMAEDAGGAATEKVAEEGLVEGGAELTGTAATAAGSTAVKTTRAAADNPFRTAGAIAGGVGLGVGAGRAAFRAGRSGRDAVRGAGGEKIEPNEIAPEKVLNGEERFPSADDPELVREDPAKAVTEQANKNTPDQIEEQFDEAGVEGDADLVKALETEPGGPGSGRAAQGFEAPEADSDLADQYETSGQSFGPELSPNFLRTNAESPDFSLRPGLPDLGNSPTAVVARTDVENPDARTIQEFDEELRDASGDTTARAIREEFGDEAPPGQNFDPVDEAEAQVPPGSEFVDVNTGPVRDALRRLGIGADFKTEIDGRTVPIRTVAPEDRVSGGSRTPGDLLDDERGQLGAGGGGSRVKRDLSRGDGFDPGTERPAPIPPTTSGPGVDVDSVEPDRNMSDVTDDVVGGPRSGGSGTSDIGDAFEPPFSNIDGGSGRGSPTPDYERPPGSGSPTGTPPSSPPPSSTPPSGPTSSPPRGPPSEPDPTGGGGGSSTSSGPFGGGSSTGSGSPPPETGSPIVPPSTGPPTTNRVPLPDFDRNSDEDELESLFGADQVRRVRELPDPSELGIDSL